MKNLRKTLATIIAAAMTMALIVMPASASIHEISAPLPSGWVRTSGDGSAGGVHSDVYYKNGEQMEFIVTEVSEWSGLGSINQNSDSAWEDYLVEFGRLSDVTIAESWEKWYPNMGSATVDTESSRSVHETINGRDYFRYDRSGFVYMNGQAIAAFDNTTFLYGEDSCLYAFYYNGWNYNTDNISDFFNMMNGLSYSGKGASSANTSVSQNTNQSGSSGGSGYTASAWARSEIEQAISLGLMPSNLKTADLTQPIDRRDFAIISLNAYEKMSGDTVSAGSNSFTDTSDNDVIKAYTAGIIAGTSETTFSPSSLLTREQAAAMLTRAYKKTIYTGWTLAGDDGFPLIYTSAGSFDDSYLISDYARGSVDFMSSKGVVSGMGDGTFAPQSTVTREQAVAIAVRMINKLDTSPQENTKGNTQNENGNNQGTQTSGEISVNLGNGEKPEITQNSAGEYVIGFDEIPSQKTHIEFDAEAPASDEEGYIIEIGVPVSDDDGESSIYYISYPAEYANGKAYADIDMSEFEEIVDSIEYAGDGKGKKLSWSLGSLIPTKKRKGIIAEKLEDHKKLSDSGNFEVHVNDKYYGSGSKKADINDLKRIGNDLEEIMANYKQKGYEIKYSSWPMQVYLKDLGESTHGQYVFGWMDVNVKKLTDGYKKSGSYDNDSGTVYCTLAHEFFHCVERGYVPKVFESRWFDEACGSYYENVFKKEKNVANTSDSYASANTEGYHQYKGVVPEYVSLLSVAVDSERGYGRRPFIEYLMRSDVGGSSFIKNVYAEGGTWTQAGISTLIEKHSGKTLGELAKGFYTKLLTTDELDAQNNSPYYLYEDIDNNRITDAYIASSVELNGQGVIAKSFSVLPYGVQLIKLDLGKVSADKGSFDVRMDSKNLSAIVAAIGSSPAAECEYYYSKKASDGYETVSNIPITAKKYLLIVINESGVGYSRDGVPGEFNVSFNNAYTTPSGAGWAKTDEEIDNLVKQFEGTVTYLRKGNSTSSVYKSDANIQLVISKYDMGASLRVTSSDGNYSYLNTDLVYNPSNGMCTGNGVSVQLQPSGFTAHSVYAGLGYGVRVHIYEGDKLAAVAEGYGGGIDLSGDVPVYSDYE